MLKGLQRKDEKDKILYRRINNLVCKKCGLKHQNEDGSVIKDRRGKVKKGEKFYETCKNA